MKSNKTVGCVTNSGEEKIMEAEKQTIAVFTNIFGEVNKGVVLAVDPGGLVKIRWERFDQMIERLWHTIAVGVECRFAIHASRDVFRKTVDGFS